MRTCAMIVLLLLAAGMARGQMLTFRGCVRLPDEQATGLSGITHTGGDNYWGVLEHQARLVRLEIKLAGDGSIAAAKIVESVPLQNGRDVEGIAFATARPDSLLCCDESPSIYEVGLGDGRISRKLSVPAIFRDIIRNYGFESLTYSPDGKTVWTANERALTIDGNPQTPANPISSITRVRLLRYSAEGDSFTPAEQFEYPTSGVHDWAGTIGLCDLAALPDGRLLALERSAAKNFSGVVAIRTRIFLIDMTGATDISKPPFDRGLVDQAPTPVHKTLLWDGLVCDEDGENLEGLCVGPQTAKGRWAVLGVVDNTDGGLGVSKPAVVAFKLDLTAPATTRPTPRAATGKAK